MSHDDAGWLGADQVSVKDAYIAMYHFVDAYWERGGRRDGSLTLLRHALGPTVDPRDETALQTSDPASWNDWLKAIRIAKTKGLPDEL
jgi:hypothetical protein